MYILYDATQALSYQYTHRHRHAFLSVQDMISLWHRAVVRVGFNQSALLLTYPHCRHAQCWRPGRQASLPVPFHHYKPPKIKVSFLHPNTEIQHHTIPIHKTRSHAHYMHMSLCPSLSMLDTHKHARTHKPRHITNKHTEEQSEKKTNNTKHKKRERDTLLRYNRSRRHGRRRRI